MTVRAKFKVSCIKSMMGNAPTGEKNAQGHAIYGLKEMKTIEMSPVYGNGDPNHENTKFWQATPTGSLSLGMVNADAAAQFELDKEYYVDFTPAQ